MSLATTPNHLYCPKLVPFCTSLSSFEKFLPKLFLPSALPAQRKLTKSSFISWFRGSPLVQGRKPSEKISTSKVNSPFVVSFRFRTSSTSLTCVLCPVLLHKPTTTSHKHAHTHLWIKLMNRHHHYSQRGAKMSFLPNVRDASWANLHPQKKIPAKTSSSSSQFTGIFLEILPLRFTFILKSALSSLHSVYAFISSFVPCCAPPDPWIEHSTHTHKPTRRRRSKVIERLNETDSSTGIQSRISPQTLNSELLTVFFSFASFLCTLFSLSRHLFPPSFFHTHTQSEMGTTTWEQVRG